MTPTTEQYASLRLFNSQLLIDDSLTVKEILMKIVLRATAFLLVSMVIGQSATAAQVCGSLNARCVNRSYNCAVSYFLIPRSAGPILITAATAQASQYLNNATGESLICVEGEYANGELKAQRVSSQTSWEF